MSSKGWKKYKLEDIAEIVGGGTPSTANSDYWGGEIPWLTPRDLSINQNRFVCHGERNITKLGLENSSAKLLPAGSILLTSRAPIGYLAIASNPICTNQGFKSLIPNTQIVDGLFLYYLLRNNVDYLKSVGVGTTFAEISGGVLRQLEFDFPDLPTQRQIAETLSALDDKIELNRQTNATLEAIAQAIFKEWFVDFRYPGATGEMVDSELGPIPKGWRVGKLGEVCRVTMGQSPPGVSYNEDGIGTPFFQGRADFDFRFPRKRVFTTDPRRFANKFDTLVSVRAPVGDMNIAAENCCIGRGLAAVLEKNGCYSFTYYFLKELSEQFKNFEDSGTVFGSINKRDFEDLTCIIPNIEIITSYEEKCRVIDDEIFICEQESRTLTIIRDAILPKLMNSEIEL
jgi:type I restriction enzyme S subunit